jgi:hypothetical protein
MVNSDENVKNQMDALHLMDAFQEFMKERGKSDQEWTDADVRDFLEKSWIVRDVYGGVNQHVINRFVQFISASLDDDDDDPKDVNDDPKDVNDDPKDVNDDPKDVNDDPSATPSDYDPTEDDFGVKRLRKNALTDVSQITNQKERDLYYRMVSMIKNFRMQDIAYLKKELLNRYMKNG